MHTEATMTAQWLFVHNASRIINKPYIIPSPAPLYLGPVTS